MACADEVEAELMLPERGMALVRTGQLVKLLYDAFPDGHGAHGTLRLSLVTVDPRGTAFRLRTSSRPSARRACDGPCSPA